MLDCPSISPLIYLWSVARRATKFPARRPRAGCCLATRWKFRFMVPLLMCRLLARRLAWRPAVRVCRRRLSVLCPLLKWLAMWCRLALLRVPRLVNCILGSMVVRLVIVRRLVLRLTIRVIVWGRCWISRLVRLLWRCRYLVLVRRRPLWVRLMRIPRKMRRLAWRRWRTVTIRQHRLLLACRRRCRFRCRIIVLRLLALTCSRWWRVVLWRRFRTIRPRPRRCRLLLWWRKLLV